MPKVLPLLGSRTLALSGLREDFRLFYVLQLIDVLAAQESVTYFLD